MLILTVIQGPDKGRKFEVTAQLPQLIGRSSEALPISDTTVSRRHAELTPDGKQWYIRDLDSQNGTWVNGVRIAARGGSWGMDDMLKRVSRERLEPFFRLHRNANVNIIRNWVGQSTEEVFFELADEYGLLVWNDFWASTQNYNIEPEDPALFLENARDTISRFRNHPSIAVWCGRNEGVPQPILNEGLEELTRTVDGTRTTRRLRTR